HQAPVLQPDDLIPYGLLPVCHWIDVYTRATMQPRRWWCPLTVSHMAHVAKQLVPSCREPCSVVWWLNQVRMQVLAQILMIRYPSSQLGEMSLEEHSQCECRPKKKDSALKPDSPRTLCPRCTQRHQRPDPRTCRCRCRRRSFLRCQGRGLELNPDTCRCRKLRR
uniref:Vascular endothelial growth factor B n=1 Tax=Rhinopithecus bieti TaxID=61621 RepID=A0A2K6LES1_RHIBE